MGPQVSLVPRELTPSHLPSFLGTHRTVNRKLLILELWGIGDLTFSTPVLARAIESGAEVHLLAKPHAKPLLLPSFPRLNLWSYDAPWTRYQGKYDLRKWDWKELFTILRALRAEKFDTAVSVRNDPRDHLLMSLIGARERIGFPRQGSGLLLSHRLPMLANRHKVDDWRTIGTALGYTDIPDPLLRTKAYCSPKIAQHFASIQKPVLCLHSGARIPVRRWKQDYFAEIIGQLRREYDFHLMLIPEPDGYGLDLAPLADSVLEHITTGELVEAIERSTLLLCNDSGPAHIAASFKRPTIAIFGPSKSDWFKPWGDAHLVAERDICPWRPCFDYCKFPEPYCMSKLEPRIVWPEIHAHLEKLLDQKLLPANLRKDENPSVPNQTDR